MASALSTSTRRDVLTLGETMLRLSLPPCGGRLAQCRSFDVWLAGSESNVAAALCVLGRSVTWASRLPDQPLGRKVEAGLRAAGIDVSAIVWAPPQERVGVFFYEPAAPPRAAAVVYDRAGSAASFLSPGDLPNGLFATHRHLHVGGITPALSPSCADTVADALRRARMHGMTVSFDVNFRTKLWAPALAAHALAPLMAQADVLICSRDDAANVFGLAGGPPAQAKALGERFGCPTVVVTAGADGAAGCREGECVAVPAVPIPATVERLGSGDAFAGGYLAGFLEDRSLEDSLRLGAAAAALKRTVLGDMLVGTRQEIEALMSPEAGAA